MNNLELFIYDFSSWISSALKKDIYDSNAILKFKGKWLNYDNNEENKNIVLKCFFDIKNKLSTFENGYSKNLTIIKEIFEAIFGNILKDIKGVSVSLELNYYLWLQEKINFFHLPVNYDKNNIYDNACPEKITQIITEKFFSLNDDDKLSYFLFIDLNFSNFVSTNNAHLKEKIVNNLFKHLDFSTLDLIKHFYILAKGTAMPSKNAKILLERLISNYLNKNIHSLTLNNNITILTSVIRAKKIINIDNKFKKEFCYYCREKNIYDTVCGIFYKQLRENFITDTLKKFVYDNKDKFDEDEIRKLNSL